MPKKKPGPSFREVSAGKNIVTQKFEVLDRVREMGRTRVTIECPFCVREVTAYVWSINGGGKRCNCGALFSGRGKAYHFSDKVVGVESA